MQWTRIYRSTAIGSFYLSDRANLDGKQRTHNFYRYFPIACECPLGFKYCQCSRRVWKRLKTMSIASDGRLRHFSSSKPMGVALRVNDRGRLRTEWRYLTINSVLIYSFSLWTFEHYVSRLWSAKLFLDLWVWFSHVGWQNRCVEGVEMYEQVELW